MIPERDMLVLHFLALYYTLTRALIQDLVFPDDDGGRIARKRLQILHDGGMVNRTNMQVVNPAMGAPAYVYYPSRKGCAYLAQEREDDRYNAVCTLTPNWQHLYHWVEVAKTHIMLDRAAERTGIVTVADWISEWSIANPDEKDPAKRYRLYTRLSDKLVCAPDAGFLLQKDGYRKVFYLEQDRDTTKNADRVAAQKAGGYAGLCEVAGHRRHFPSENVGKFSVLVVAPREKRREALRKAFGAKPSCWLYKFAALTDLTPDTFLTAKVWFPCVGEAAPLVEKGGAS